MGTDMSTGQPPPPMPDDGAFDLRARAEMALAFDPGEPPAHLLREPPPWPARRGVRRALAGLLLAAAVTGTVLTMRPPTLVRDAIAHEDHERLLRGSFIDAQPLLARLGLGRAEPLPGFPQLLRLCDVEGHPAYHLTTFFEKGGMVTVFAFEPSVALPDGGGWWNGVHWRVIRSRNGQPLLLIAQQHQALEVAQSSLLGAAPPG